MPSDIVIAPECPQGYSTPAITDGALNCCVFISVLFPLRGAFLSSSVIVLSLVISSVISNVLHNNIQAKQ